MTNESERAAFEKWYVEIAFDYDANPLGTRECSLQRMAWMARAQLIAEQAKAEPVAWIVRPSIGVIRTPELTFHGGDAEFRAEKGDKVTPLYLHPAPSTDRVAAQCGDDALPFYAGDLFWPDDDGETCATDMCGLIQELADNGQIESGQTLQIRRAKNLHTVEVVVTIDDEGDVDYRESLRVTPADGELA